MKTLKTKHFLILINGAIVVFAFFLLTVINSCQLKSIAFEQNKKNIRMFSDVVHRTLLTFPAENYDETVKKLSDADSDIRISIINDRGFLVADSGSAGLSSQNHLNREEVASSLNGRECFSVRYSTVNKKNELYYAVPLLLNGNIFSLRLSMPIEANIYWSGNYFATLLFCSIFILALILGFSFLLSNHVIKGIENLKLAASHYQKQDFSFESAVTSPKELKDLSVTMNVMAKTIGQNVDQLKKLEKVRKDFVANVSHELKTPITSIKGYSETLLDGAIEEKEIARNFVAIIQGQTNRLQNIIEDLLTLSSLEQNNYSIDLCDCDLVGVVKNACIDFEVLAQKKDICLNFSSPFAEWRNTKINAGLMAQAVGNIIDNAIKYCPAGSIVNVSLNQTAPKNICIIIEDNGNGIPPELSDRIFERFFRVDKGRSREMGGTGLGLAITKHIIEVHGGTICHQNAQTFKKGSRFIIQL